MATGLVWHELYMWHDTSTYAGIVQPNPKSWIQPSLHFENPETKRRIKNLLDATGYIEHLKVIAPREPSDEELLTVHSKEYLSSLASIGEKGGEPAFATPMGVGGYEIARLSVGGCLSLLEAILEGTVENGYVLCRPPGHHATGDAAMGFCFLANGAIVAKAAQKRGLEKVAIVDWDVHHGNGAEGIFYSDPNVLTISLHQDNCFPPNSGAADRLGAGDGLGFNINVPLPPGSGRGAYLYSFEKIVLPSLRSFEPDLILVASGFDAMGQDPLGRNLLFSKVYGEMTSMLSAVADEYCGGKLLMTHEGGYNPNTTPFAAISVLEQLTGISSNVEDPYEPFIAEMGGQELQSHQKELIDSIALQTRRSDAAASKTHLAGAI